MENKIFMWVGGSFFIEFAYLLSIYRMNCKYCVLCKSVNIEYIESN